tara:strand:- start:286 stop:489 length:204 start_codon:yes stop_codon:yes gene_type:complete
MHKYSFLIPFFGLGLIFHYVFLPNAYAYIDPGSGSAIIYVIISAIVGVGMTMKVYWARIKHKLLTRD